MTVPNKSRLLIVDDQIANLKILKMTFEEEGYSVLTAIDVGQAKQLLKEKGDEIDLVLSDIQMPGETGFDLVRWAQAQHMDEIPILLITSQLPEPEHRIFGLSLGAVDYVLRTLDPQELVVRVHRAIEHFRQLRGLRASLEGSENLAAIGRSLAAANHEVKNLAQMVKVTGAVLKRQFAIEGPIDKAMSNKALGGLMDSISMLCDVTKSMNSMLDNLGASNSSLDISELVQQVVAMIQPLLRGNYFDVSCVSPESLWGMANGTPLKQVIINLLLNAQDAISESSPQGGGEIKLALFEKGQEVVIEVTDNGVGLSTKSIRQEFPAFATTKQLRGGKGLGLWLSSRFILGMGGTLTLESKGPGKGALARIVLKRVDPAEKPAQIDLSKYFDNED